jgi:hypothetical protein
MSILLVTIILIVLRHDVAVLLRERPSPKQPPEPDASQQSLTSTRGGN